MKYFIAFLFIATTTVFAAEKPKPVATDTASTPIGKQADVIAQLQRKAADLEDAFQRSLTLEQRGLQRDQLKIVARIEMIQIIAFPDSTVRIKK